jgi:hypothetical protein
VRAEIPSARTRGRERQLTHENDAAIAQLSLNPAETSGSPVR